MADREVRLHIPFATLFKVALFALFVYALSRLVPLLVMIFVATLLAVVLDAGSAWLQKHGFRRGLAITLVSVLTFAVVLAFLFVVVPKMVMEIGDLVKRAPELSKKINQTFPAAAPYVNSITAKFQRPPNPQQLQQGLMRLLMFGRYALEGLTAIFLTVVMAIYLVVEGRRTFAWLISLAPETQRKKLARTAEEVRPVMLAYMRGQLITSAASAATALAVLLPFGVPAAVPLAALAFIGDFVPVIGFLASIVPAVLMALLVSPTAAVSVAAVYIAYQLLENYVIAPKVYGNAMRLSTLTVLLVIAIGGTLLGPVGAIIFLPIAASYPAVERIWLARHLPADTIPRHEALENP